MIYLQCVLKYLLLFMIMYSYYDKYSFPITLRQHSLTIDKIIISPSFSSPFNNINLLPQEKYVSKIFDLVSQGEQNLWISEILKLLKAINKDIKILFKMLCISNVLNKTFISSRSLKGFKSQIFAAFPSGSWWKLDNIQSEHFSTHFKLIEK